MSQKKFNNHHKLSLHVHNIQVVNYDHDSDVTDNCYGILVSNISKIVRAFVLQSSVTAKQL